MSDGTITTLLEALSVSYYAFFDNFPEVSFSACVGGHVIAFDGAQFENLLGKRKLVVAKDGLDPDWALMS